MSKIKSLVGRFAREESGATMVEYAVMVALIAAVCIATVKTIGTKSNTAFGVVNSNLP